MQKQMHVQQKEIFLQSEGDAWFARNMQSVATRKLPDDDPIVCEVLDNHDEWIAVTILRKHHKVLKA